MPSNLISGSSSHLTFLPASTFRGEVGFCKQLGGRALKSLMNQYFSNKFWEKWCKWHPRMSVSFRFDLRKMINVSFLAGIWILSQLMVILWKWSCNTYFRLYLEYFGQMEFFKENDQSMVFGRYLDSLQLMVILGKWSYNTYF